MRIHERFSTIEPGSDQSVCSIGTFDGVHRGHQHLIGAAVRDAHASGARAVVVTFEPHPREVLSGVPMRYLTSPADKAQAIAALGVDDLVVYSFTREVANVSAAEFVGVLKRDLNLAQLWIGPDFSLGHKREGNAAYLAGLGGLLDFEVRVAEPLLLDERPVSSSRIRDSLGHGDIADVARCLGRPYALDLVRRDSDVWCAGEKRVLPKPGAYLARIGVRTGGIVFADSACETRLTGDLATHDAAQLSVALE
jgi:riboflavin kinase / FMN adenylyltransferase